ncbi:hypothetical protein RclHR1_06120007 [Rhizophagus clarus]|uniref:Uncharacterized protein n=1 Tax=Rhizophagus clarus TaxID=94130 RepID=A0A2Z6RWK2_9GLOM|nr:hypothetical protein RclHR1_06120007 [Rhizophagus clarus]
MTFIDDKLLADLYYPDYWNRNQSILWGSISDWDMYYINQFPHRTLGLELEVLLQHLRVQAVVILKRLPQRKHYPLLTRSLCLTTPCSC